MKERAQGMAEYGLILAGIAILAIVAIFLLGPRIGELINKSSVEHPVRHAEEP